MAEKLEDLNLPNASVMKIIKEALPESVNIGKDARAALSRAASVFVLYVTSQASKEAQKANRKALTGQDVITALEDLEFEEFVEPLQEIHKNYLESKKSAKNKKKVSTNDDVEMVEADENDESNEETLDETGE